MVEWLGGNRVLGTNAERLATPFAPSGVGGWKELGRTTLGSASDSISVSSLSDKRYYMLLFNGLNSGSINVAFQCNNDSGNNYNKRASINGAADSTSGATVNWLEVDGGSTANPRFGVGYIANYTTKEKLGILHGMYQNTAGAANAPNRIESFSKWANTTNAINRIDAIDYGTGQLDTNSELVVLGYDPSDTHTTNFWEELGSASWVSGTSLPTVSFTAKKYLWIQFFTSGGIGGDGANRVSVRVGNGSIDTGSNYAYRNSESGGADGTDINASRWLTHTGNKKNFTNMFIVNNSANEKLVIYHTSEGSGTGAGSAPTRIEGVGKWTGAGQINQISVFDYTGGNSFNAGEIKVWGSN